MFFLFIFINVSFSDKYESNPLVDNATFQSVLLQTQF